MNGIIYASCVLIGIITVICGGLAGSVGWTYSGVGMWLSLIIMLIIEIGIGRELNFVGDEE